jgi:hypothetical protein
MGILDDAAKQQDSTQPQVTPATPTAQSAQPTEGGSILEQAAAQQKAAAPSTFDAPPPESLVDRWTREAYETVGQAVPEWAATGMRGVQHGLLDKFHQSSRELGNIAEHKINTVLAYADQAMGDLDEDLGGKKQKHEPIPAYAKGLESKFTENKFETESPITAGVTGGVSNLGGQILGDPTNWPFIAKGLLTKVGAVGEAALKPWAEKLMSKGFGIQMTKGVYDQLDELSGQWSKMNDYEKSKAITQIIAGTYMAQDALRSGFKGKPSLEKPTTVGPEQGGEGPRTSTQTGTVAGEQTSLRPTTRTTAGVEAPVSAKAAANLEGQQPSILQRAVEQITPPVAEQKFGRQETAPAATRQMHSTLGQVAEDKIAGHLAVVNGETAPDAITGTQQASKFTQPDEAWREMQKTAQDTTLKTADDISKREQAAWESKRDESIQEYKDLVDRHNKNIDDYNAQVKPDERMQHAVFDPSEVAVPERPQSYNELRAEVQAQEANTKSQDAAVREEAINKGVPKAQKALDNWFKQHADEITPAEYESFKKLWADSERFKEIANGLRASVLKGDLTGNKMRQVEASMNTRQIRRGQSPEAFARLLGPDGYNNWHNVAKLFDTVKDPNLPPDYSSWGKYAAEYLGAALIPHLYGLGLPVKMGIDYVLNHVMFDPEFGSTFSDLVDWMKQRGGLAAQSIKEMPQNLLDKFVNVIKSYQDSKASSQKGMAGADISKPRFGRKGLGGPAEPTKEDVQNASAPERDTSVLAQVQHDMPTASLSQQLMEAGRRANPKNPLTKGGADAEESFTHNAIADWHNQHKGFSFNPERGFIRDEPVYSVAGKYTDTPFQKVIKGETITPEDVKEFTNRPEVKKALASDPNLNVGGWNYKGDANLELSNMFESKEDAIAEGKRLNQDSIYDHATRTTIPTGGSAAEELRQQTQTPPKTLTAYHWSPEKNLTEISPEKFGANRISPESRRLKAFPDQAKPVTFLGTSKYNEPLVQKGRTKYVADLNPADYYDLETDPKGLMEQATRNAAKDGFYGSDATSSYLDSLVKSKGYSGHIDANGVIRSFEPVKVRPYEAPQEKRPEPPQPVYIDRKSGLHEVVTGPASDRTGHLLAKDIAPEEGKQDSGEVQIATHWVDKASRGKGVGAAQIEALAQSLPKTKTALLSDTSMTDSAIGSWKKLQSIYPTAVSEQPNGQWKFDLEKLRTPAITRTTAVPKGSTVELMNNPLPVKGSGATGVNTIDVAKALNKYTKRNLGALKPGSEPEEMVARATELAASEAQYQLGQNNSGTTWYTEQMDEHDKIAREMRPTLKDDTKLSLFKMAEAVLSSGQKPYRNFTSTMEAWDHYEKTGAFPSTNPETGKSWGPRGIKAYANALESINRLVEEKGEKGAVDWLMGEHPVSELREYNKDVAGKKADLRHGVIILGEKRGPFAQNLHGMETAFTADMWVSRTWNRWMGTIEVEPETGEITSDSPRNAQERSLMKQSFAEVASKMGMTTSSLQAVLWYYEQALYSAHGTPKESWSFSDAARRAQAEEKANAPTQVEPPQEPVSFGPRPAELARRAREKAQREQEESFNPEEFATAATAK